MPKAPPRIALAPDLDISRVVVGLWQVADMERGGRTLDPEASSSAMLAYAREGFDSFDMADHYGTAAFSPASRAASRRARRAPPLSPNGARRRGR
jgi:aryl-alcohol dehydrogenase-like predicted oxidoreductase